MRPIENFDQVQAAYGRNGGRLKAGTYIVRIDGVKEDMTGYGNQCLKLVYDVAEGPCAGFFADIAGDEDSNWRHTIEVDVDEGNGKWLKGLIDSITASNPGFVWNWNENMLVGKFVGVTFQERQTTAKKGKNKGKMQSYLDLWGFLSIDRVRAGDFDTPPINDKRDYDLEERTELAGEAAQQAAPVAVPQGMGAQAPAYGGVPGGVPNPGVPGAAPIAPNPVVPQGAVAQVPGAQAPQYPQQTVQYQQQPVQPSVTQGEFASQDIPF